MTKQQNQREGEIIYEETFQGRMQRLGDQFNYLIWGR